MQYLLVIDMQEDYVGAGRNRKAYPYDEKLLIDRVNERLLEYLKKNNVTSLELVGVDGNYCVGNSALEGIKKGFAVVCNESCIGVGKNKKFVKVRRKLVKNGVQFI